MSGQTDIEARRAAFRRRFPGAEEKLAEFRSVFGGDCRLSYVENKDTGDRAGKRIEGWVQLSADKEAEAKRLQEQDAQAKKMQPKKRGGMRYAA